MWDAESPSVVPLEIEPITECLIHLMIADKTNLKVKNHIMKHFFSDSQLALKYLPELLLVWKKAEDRMLKDAVRAVLDRTHKVVSSLMLTMDALDGQNAGLLKETFEAVFDRVIEQARKVYVRKETSGVRTP